MKNIKMNVDLRIVSGALLVALIASVVLWKPWVSESTRTISVTGEASKKTEPDEYQFSPVYQKKGTDRATIQKELSDTINSVIAKLKELGVKENDITLSSSTYDNFYNDGANEVTSNSLTIIVTDKELSQKVQDYLLTTAPQGQVSPVPTFSTAKRKTVEKDLRGEAIADARDKAEQMVKGLGARVGKVVTIEDQTNGMVFPMMAKSEMGMVSTDAVAGSVTSLPIMGGSQEINYSVNVTYQIK